VSAGKSPCTDEEFVVIWQTSKNVKEAAKLAGYATAGGSSIAIDRARRLRKLGVPLKLFRVARLARLRWMAERAAKEEIP
jgi:hypothetical protein